jgi:hypothetical protein
MMMKKIMVLLLSFFSTMVIAETELLVEKKGQEVHFVYPDSEADGAYYYAVWSNEKNSCEKINLDSKALILSNASNKFYQLPEKGGHLCFRRSYELLNEKWNPYQIMLDEKFLIIKIDDSRGVGDIEPEPLDGVETKKQLIPCQFNSDDLPTCELEL